MTGLFGTYASLFTDIGLIMVQLSTIFALIARFYIGKKQPTKHRTFMTIATMFLYIFLFFYILNYLTHGVKTFGGPVSLQLIYYIFLIIHMAGATFLGLAATMLVLRSLKRIDRSQENEWKMFNFEKDYRSFHRKIGKINIIMWVFTAVSGLVVYTLLYVLYAPIKLT